VINTNLPAILHRLRDSLRTVKNGYNWLPLLRLNPPTDGFTWDDLRKVFSECQWMAKVPNGAEEFPKFSTGWVGCTNVSDDRRQTDRRAITYSERELTFTFAKNGLSYQHQTWYTTRILYRLAVARHALTQRSMARSHGDENRHGRTDASYACCYGLCRRGSACRYDCLCFLVIIVIIITTIHTEVTNNSSAAASMADREVTTAEQSYTPLPGERKSPFPWRFRTPSK